VSAAETRERENTASLTHYTNARGLEGLIKSQELWLTNIEHLNDPSEFAHGVAIARQELSKQSEGQHPAIAKLATTVETAIKERLTLSMSFFVASFSTEADELGQWRAYGDDGRGFAIGISPKLLWPSERKSPREMNNTPKLAQVIYDEKESRRRQAEVVSRAIQCVRSCVSEISPSDQAAVVLFLRHVSAQLTLGLLLNALATKHISYQAEREFRLILARPTVDQEKLVRTRIRGPEFVPYVPVPLRVREDNALTHIVLGPAALPQAESGLRHFLRSSGLNPEAIIKRSTIPYRSHRVEYR
jgi:hypothetical protein